MNGRERWRERIRPVIGFPGLLLLAFVIERAVVMPYAARRTPEAGVQYWERQAERHPDFPLTLVRLGMEYSQAGNLVGARDAYARALAAKPDCEQAAVGLNEVLRSSGDVAGATAKMMEFAAANPGCLVCEQDIASGLLALGRLDEAKRHVQLVLAVEHPVVAPEYGPVDLRTDALALAGRIYAAAGEREQARDYFQQALARRPRDGKVQSEMARLRQLDGSHSAVR
ncbi:MAG TPA: tetratricopeptide repeat protein [Myxococcota bacterium]|nr:tetratricopeptide repeat protein [Myxococcota bacterium]